ncbi:hypothetical protein BDZ94DRAFT_1214767 [Collybia nuda]|uniref:Methyltransferase type 11 domain-containing protein n=1 Tax=Collybia nuda TaxID=64659 RepID=A0A9P5Y9R7_9AGAR|nr:hypothetical protein BDZ94DRAFT_1214767 [Collybia nuda]
MVEHSELFNDPQSKPPLDERLYSLAEDDLAFFKAQTGIEDEVTLKEHIISVQKKAYEVYGCPCIRGFEFTRSRISRIPAYSSVLQLSRERKGAILLEIACCLGNDLRKAVTDGWPAQNIIGTDLRQGFWGLGHELFRSSPETFPATFIAGDVFDSAFISPRAPFYDDPENHCPPLASLTSLTPIQGHISAIYATHFFHLFDFTKQLELAHRIASLLSPIPGSIAFGMHIGLPEKGWRYEVAANADKTPYKMFYHSPESWTEMWDGEVFKKGSVKVDAIIKKVELSELGSHEFFFLLWSITRL